MIVRRQRFTIRRGIIFVLGGVVLLAAGCDAPAPPAAQPSAPVQPPAVTEAAPKPAPRADPAAERNKALADAVRKALADDPRLRTFAIDVRASDGKVEIYGTVDSTGTRDAVAKLAGAVPGVSSVDNRLVLVRGS